MKYKTLDNTQKEKVRKWIEHTLNLFKFVAWDRFIIFDGVPLLRFYGWIEREKDSYKDFIILDFDYISKRVFFLASSSAKYSAEIKRILKLKQVKICQRVEKSFNILRACKL